MAIRGYYESPLHAEPWIESALDVRDRNGNSLPGYGWIFPVGDGTINVGIGLLSTFRDWKNVNTSHLMNEFAATAPAYWGITPEGSTGPPTGGRLPMGGSVTPNVGPTWVLVGDAAGTINPFNGEGIDYAYETGRLAAELLHEALTTGDGMALQRYPRLLEEEYGLYFKVAPLREGDRQPRAARTAHESRHASRARSWSGCCASWRTCCARTSSVPRKRPTRRSPRSSESSPNPAPPRGDLGH